MKIHEYNEMMKWLTRPAPDPSIKQLASSNPLNIPAHMQHQMEGGQLTPEEFYQNQSIPITERPLTGAEGGRVQYKPGGLVEPGVTHYAKRTYTEEQKAAQKEYKRKYWLENRERIRKKLIAKGKIKGTGIGKWTRTGFIINKIEAALGDPATAGPVDIPELIKKYDLKTNDDVQRVRAQLKKRGYTLKTVPVDDVVEFAMKKSGIKNPAFNPHRQKLQNLYEIIQKYNNMDDISRPSPAGVRVKFADITQTQLMEEAGYGKHAKPGRVKAAKYLIDNYFLTTPDKMEAELTKMLSDDSVKLSEVVDFTKKWSTKYNKPLPQINIYLREFPLFKDNKEILRLLNNPEYTDKFKRNKNFNLMSLGDFIEETNSRVNFSLKASTPEQQLQAFAYRHTFKAGGEKIEWLTDPRKTNQSDWVFKYKGKVYDSSDLALSRNDPNFKTFWKVDEQIKKYNDFLVTDTDTLKKLGLKKPTSMRNIMSTTLGWGTGSKGYYGATPLDKDHLNLSEEPFEVRPMDTRINRGAGQLKRDLLAGRITQPQYEAGLKKIGYTYKGQIDFDNPQAFDDLIKRDLDFAVKARQKPEAYLRSPRSIAFEKLGLIKNNIIENASPQIKNKIAVVLNCPVGRTSRAEGGRISFAAGSDPTGCITSKLKADPKTTLSRILDGVPEIRAPLAQTLGPDGWRFLGVDYTPNVSKTAQLIGEGVSKLPKPVGSVLKGGYGAARWLLRDPFFAPLIPVELAVTSAYQFEKNKDNIMKSLKENSLVTEMARKYKMDAKDVRSAILEKYRRAVLNTEGGLEEQMAFEPKHDEVVETFDKKFYPFWDPNYQAVGPKKTDTSFVKDPAFSIGTGSAILGMRQESEEEEHKLRSGEIGGTQFYKKQPFYTKKDYYPEDYKDKTLAGQIRSAERIPFENLRGLEDPLPEGGFYAGGRVPFGKGGMGRREFLTWLGSLVGGIAGIKSGLVKFGVGKGKGKVIVKAGDHIIQSTPGMPDWYIPLINRIVKEGDDVTAKLATVEREIVHTKKIGKGEEVTVYQDMNTGNVRVDYTSPDIMGEGAVGPVSLEYRAPQVIDEGKMAGQKTNPEFEAVEPEPVSHTMGPDDYAIEWDGANVVGRVEDLMSDTNKLKQFAKKKKPTMKEIVESGKKKKAVQKVHENESDYIVSKQGDYSDYDDYLPDIDDIE